MDVANKANYSPETGVGMKATFSKPRISPLVMEVNSPCCLQFRKILQVTIKGCFD
jgi:hypothetical protein